MKNNQRQVAFGQKSGLEKSWFCVTVLSYQNYFKKQLITIIFGNKERNVLLIPGFLRTLTQTEGLSKV